MPISIPYEYFIEDSKLKLRIIKFMLRIIKFLLRSIMKSEMSLHQIESCSIRIEEFMSIENKNKKRST